jgi:NaMN:DMB phosphoribosyltransferase
MVAWPDGPALLERHLADPVDRTTSRLPAPLAGPHLDHVPVLRRIAGLHLLPPAAASPGAPILQTAAPTGVAVTRTTRSLGHLAVSVIRSAERLDRLEAVGRSRDVPAEILAHERALLERRCLRLLDAVRYDDDPTWRWDQEARA